MRRINRYFLIAYAGHQAVNAAVVILFGIYGGGVSDGVAAQQAGVITVKGIVCQSSFLQVASRRR